MDAFLDRFYDEVDDHLLDPHVTRRLTPAKKYRDLFTVQRRIWSHILAMAGDASEVGRAEAEIEIEANRQHYALPAGFGRFISMERRDDSDPDVITGKLNTIPLYSREFGVEIISPSQSLRLNLIPTSAEAGTWTLTYLRGPVLLHNATATAIKDAPVDAVINDTWTLSTPVAGTNRITNAGDFTPALLGETITFASPTNETTTVEGATATVTAATYDYIEFAAVTGLAATDTFAFDVDWCWLVGGTPATNYGEMIKSADYYNGSMLRVYSATLYYPVVKEILDYFYDSDATTWTFKLRHPWGTLPTGTVLYEICPELCEESLESLYAFDVAIMNTAKRTHLSRRGGLLDERRRCWAGAQEWLNTTMDRAPSRVRPQRGLKLDPYATARG